MTNNRRIVITGFSVMAAIGMNKEEFLKNSKNGYCGIQKTGLFHTDKLRTDYFGEVKKKYVYEISSKEEESRLECIFNDLCTELLKDSQMTKEQFQSYGAKAGFSFATSVGTNDYITAHIKNIIKKSISISNLHKLPYKLGIRGPVFTNTSACSAGTTAIGTGFSLIKSGITEMMVVGGIDPLTEFSSYGFHSMQNLSEQPCKPFDKKRNGITLGEGGALFLLEELNNAKKRNAKIYGEVLGYGLGNDAYHATSPDPTGKGAYRVMKQALKQGNISPEKVDYINTHGTGTLINDSMEIKAVDFFDSPFFVSSTKSMIGHCLAAAGAIEMAATILSIYDGFIFPTVNLEEAEEHNSKINFIREKAIEYPLKYALSNSFAFGGNAASVLVGEYKDE